MQLRDVIASLALMPRIVMFSLIFFSIGTATASSVPDPSIPRAKPTPPSVSEQPYLSRGLTGAEKALKLAVKEALAGRHEKAQRLMPHGWDLGQAVVDWLRYTDPNANVTFQEIEDFLNSHGHWPRTHRLRRNAEATLPLDAEAGLSDAERIAWFKSYPPLTGQGAMALAAAFKRLGKSDEADALLRSAWHNLHFVAAEEKTFLKRFPGIVSKDDHFQRLDRLLYDRERSTAKRQAKRMGNDYRALANARLALVLHQPGVDTLIKRVPGELSGDSGLLHERIQWRYRKRRLNGVLDLLEDAASSNINPAHLWRVRRWAARKLIADKAYEPAYETIAAHGVDEGLGLAEGEWLAGWVALFYLKDPERAVAHFKALHDMSGSPISRARGAFWTAEAARLKGDSELEKLWTDRAARYVTTFYGQVAARRIDNFVPPIEGQAPSETEHKAFASTDLARVAALLEKLGQERLFEVFVRHMIDRANTATDFHLVANFAKDMGRLDLSLAAAKSARRQGKIIPRLLFPERELPTADMPEAALTLAVIRQESAFEVDAVSRAGARGLMQLMPATAKLVARSEGERFVRDWLTLEPEYNIRLGRSYLQSRIERYDGSYVLALAAYNAGGHRVDRWIKEFGDPRTDEVELVYWIEQIPFSETRNYVQRVLEAMLIYRSRHTPQFTWAFSPPRNGAS